MPLDQHPDYGFLVDMIQNMQSSRQTLKYAVIIVSSVPMLILYPALQRYFVKGTMVGSLKG